MCRLLLFQGLSIPGFTTFNLGIANDIYDSSSDYLLVCFVYLQDVSNPLPCLVTEGNRWKLFFEEASFLNQAMNSFSTALQAWYSLFWVFSVKYPETLKYTCNFIERYCMGCKCTVPGAVKRLANKLIKN